MALFNRYTARATPVTEAGRDNGGNARRKICAIMPTINHNIRVGLGGDVYASHCIIR